MQDQRLRQFSVQPPFSSCRGRGTVQGRAKPGEETSGNLILRKGEVKGGSPYHQYSPGPVSLSQGEKTGVEYLGEPGVAATTLEHPASCKILTQSSSVGWCQDRFRSHSGTAGLRASYLLGLTWLLHRSHNSWLHILWQDRLVPTYYVRAGSLPPVLYYQWCHVEGSSLVWDN